MGGSVGCRPGGNIASRHGDAISYITCSTSARSQVTGSPSSRFITGARAASSSMFALPISIAMPSAKDRHDLAGKHPEALQDLLLRNDLGGVDDEIDAVDANRLPPFDGGDDLLRAADRDPLRNGSAVAGTVIVVRRARREVAERMIGPRRVRLTGRQQMGVQQTEHPQHEQTSGGGVVRILVAEEEVQRGDALVHGADRIALLDAATILPGAALLLGVTGCG